MGSGGGRKAVARAWACVLASACAVSFPARAAQEPAAEIRGVPACAFGESCEAPVRRDPPPRLRAAQPSEPRARIGVQVRDESGRLGAGWIYVDSGDGFGARAETDMDGLRRKAGEGAEGAEGARLAVSGMRFGLILPLQ